MPFNVNRGNNKQDPTEADLVNTKTKATGSAIELVSTPLVLSLLNDALFITTASTGVYLLLTILCDYGG